MYASKKTSESVFKTLWKKEKLSYIAMLYCDAQGEISSTPIRTEHGAIYLENEQWPYFDGLRFASLEELLETLERQGFKQVAGELDTVELPGTPFPQFPKFLAEQLTEPGMFMLDRHYSVQVQFDSLLPGPSAFPLRFEGDSVYVYPDVAGGNLSTARFDNVESVLNALGEYGADVRVLGWTVRSRNARIPEIRWI